MKFSYIVLKTFAICVIISYPAPAFFILNQYLLFIFLFLAISFYIYFFYSFTCFYILLIIITYLVRAFISLRTAKAAFTAFIRFIFLIPILLNLFILIINLWRNLIHFRINILFILRINLLLLLILNI